MSTQNLYMTAHSSISHKKWKQFKCLSADEWVKKMWSIHTMGCSLAIKENEVLIYPTTWMKLQSIMLNKSKIQEIICGMIPYI